MNMFQVQLLQTISSNSFIKVPQKFALPLLHMGSTALSQTAKPSCSKHLTPLYVHQGCGQDRENKLKACVWNSESKHLWAESPAEILLGQVNMSAISKLSIGLCSAIPALHDCLWEWSLYVVMRSLVTGQSVFCSSVYKAQWKHFVLWQFQQSNYLGIKPGFTSYHYQSGLSH